MLRELRAAVDLRCLLIERCATWKALATHLSTGSDLSIDVTKLW